MKTDINTRKTPNWISIPLIAGFGYLMIHTLITAVILWIQLLQY